MYDEGEEPAERGSSCLKLVKSSLHVLTFTSIIFLMAVHQNPYMCKHWGVRLRHSLNIYHLPQGVLKGGRDCYEQKCLHCLNTLTNNLNNLQDPCVQRLNMVARYFIKVQSILRMTSYEPVTSAFLQLK